MEIFNSLQNFPLLIYFVIWIINFILGSLLNKFSINISSIQICCDFTHFEVDIFLPSFLFTLILYTSSFTKYQKEETNANMKKKTVKATRVHICACKNEEQNLTSIQTHEKIYKRNQTKNIISVCIKRKEQLTILKIFLTGGV